MEPFLRPATASGALAKPSPDGWTTHPAGLWRGRVVEVVYDDRLHDVALLQSVPSAIAAGLANAGWHRRGCDGAHEWWVRDRVAAVQRRTGFSRPVSGATALSR